MLAFVRRFAIAIAVVLGFFAPLPVFRRYIPAGWAFFALLPEHGAVGDHNVAAGGPVLLVLLALIWFTYTLIVYLFITVVVPPAPRPVSGSSMPLGSRGRVSWVPDSAKSNEDNARFQDAVRGLQRGDFSRLEPLFIADTKTGSGRGQPPIIQWIEDGRLLEKPAAASEALTCACFLGRTEVAAHLLERGVDSSGGAATGLNALHWAANRGQLEAVRLLLRWKAPLEARNMHGGNVLDTAVWSAINEPRRDHLPIIEELVRAGARLEYEKLPTGREDIDIILRRAG